MFMMKSEGKHLMDKRLRYGFKFPICRQMIQVEFQTEVNEEFNQALNSHLSGTWASVIAFHACSTLYLCPKMTATYTHRSHFWETKP